MASRKTLELRSVIYAAACLALAIILPLLTGGNAALGQMFCPMHLPVFLCGFIAGPFWGGAVGFLAPFLRFLIFGSPALYPMAVRMSAELLVYGVSAALFYRYLPKKPTGIAISLICAQLFGRIAWGAVQFALSIIDPKFPFSVEFVIAQTLTPAIYGILLQLVIIPPVVWAMQKAKYISKY